jgi:hypothetical protein
MHGAVGVLCAFSALVGAATAWGAAGRPVVTNDLLCGKYTLGSDRVSGASSIHHPAGASSNGQQYDYTGGNCKDEYNGLGGFNQGDGTYTWTLSHSSVNPDTERGTEHGLYTLSQNNGRVGGFNGRITNFDFGQTPDSCGDRDIYYSSGHQFDPACEPSAPGNFNTHGGAQTGDHFRGMYGTIVYQDDTGDPIQQLQSPCPAGSQDYCFQAILKGQTN